MNDNTKRILKSLKFVSQKDEQKAKDETYIINLCDRVLNDSASRQHRFDFLTGDTGVKLPVDAYYEKYQLVVEYHERQHTESVKFFNKKKTASGVSRDEQRRIYDERRKETLPKHGIEIAILSYNDFNVNSQKRIIRNPEKDLEIVRQKLKRFIQNK
ncbi:hypothetical protein [Bacteroides heparinolyticus]|uniref:hypothetical protein n=1 Tax=Prevotella heparinolytica TaxID=28113 RepID=UPI003F9FB72C